MTGWLWAGNAVEGPFAKLWQITDFSSDISFEIDIPGTLVVQMISFS